jgi:DNA repair protein RadA/Sms
VPEGVVAFGEVGLAGEIRGVSNAEQRIAEAERLGFTHVIIPYNNLKNITGRTTIRVSGVKNVREAYEAIL